MMFSSADGRVESIHCVGADYSARGRWREAGLLMLMPQIAGNENQGPSIYVQVTLFAGEAIRRMQSETNVELTSIKPSHNIITAGIDTDMLEATYFTVGTVELRGIGPSSGIRVPDEYRNHRRLHAAMRDCVGQVAEVIHPGVVLPGDQIALGGLATALQRAS